MGPKYYLLMPSLLLRESLFYLTKQNSIFQVSLLDYCSREVANIFFTPSELFSYYVKVFTEDIREWPYFDAT
jgi:hypothetical protein